MKSIGTQHESALHRELKLKYAMGGAVEVERDGYVCDALDPSGAVVEVQTENFGALREKIIRLAAGGPVRLVHPVIVTKTIELFDPGGELLSRRKSPKKGSFWNLFDKLVRAPDLAILPNLTIEVVLLDASEKRIADGKGSWRRKGVSIGGRTLSCYRETIVMAGRGDYRKRLPFKRGEEFNSGLLAERAGIKETTARRALYVLYRIGAVKRTGKKDRYWMYKTVR